MLDGEVVLAPRSIKQAEVEMRLRVVRPQLDRTQQELLGVVELALLEQNEAEVGVKDEDFGVLARESPIDHFRFRERVRLEIDESEEVQDVGVVRAQFLRVLQLPARLGKSRFLKRFAAAVVMEKENALIEWRLKRTRIIPIGH